MKIEREKIWEFISELLRLSWVWASEAVKSGKRKTQPNAAWKSESHALWFSTPRKAVSPTQAIILKSVSSSWEKEFQPRHSERAFQTSKSRGIFYLFSFILRSELQYPFNSCEMILAVHVCRLATYTQYKYMYVTFDIKSTAWPYASAAPNSNAKADYVPLLHKILVQCIELMDPMTVDGLRTWFNVCNSTWAWRPQTRNSIRH